MTKPDEYFPVNTIPALSWAFELYLKNNGRFKDAPVVELILQAGQHRELLSKKGGHEIIVWISRRRIYVRARCLEDKDCEFNVDRIDGRDREALKKLAWDKIDARRFFVMLRKWIMRLDLDNILFIRALNTVCDHKVRIPLTTQYGRTFEKFDEYRRNRWPEDVTPDDMDRFIEELLMRVSFWFQSAAAVGALV
ncbi:MAG: hypothetical protein QXS20_01635 [Candidatus Thorarchaeota archaeon]